MSVYVGVLFIFVPAERQSSFSYAPHEDPQSHYDLPVNSHIPGHYDLPPVRRPPSPRRAPQWHPQQQSTPSFLFWNDLIERADLLLFSDNQSWSPPHRAAARPLFPLNTAPPWAEVVPTWPWQTCHPRRLRAAAKTAGLWRHQQGFSCSYLPRQKLFTRLFKASTCVWTLSDI